MPEPVLNYRSPNQQKARRSWQFWVAILVCAFPTLLVLILLIIILVFR